LHPRPGTSRQHNYAFGMADLVLAVLSRSVMSRLASPLRATRPFGELNLRKRDQVEKLTTSHLARRLGLQSGILLNRLIGRGFIELKNGRKYLTPDGRRAGGEEITRRAKGRFIVWPQDLLLKILE
jgi:hypothetical protein